MWASASGGRVTWLGVPSSFQRNWVMEVAGGMVPGVVSSARRGVMAGQGAAGAGGGVMTGAMAVRWRLPSRVVSWRARVVVARVRVAVTWAGVRGAGGGSAAGFYHASWLPWGVAGA